jgi:hypothetical protein
MSVLQHGLFWTTLIGYMQAQTGTEVTLFDPGPRIVEELE